MRHTVSVLLLILAPAGHAALVNVTPYAAPGVPFGDRPGASALVYSEGIDIDGTCYSTPTQYVPGSGTATLSYGGGNCGFTSVTATLALNVLGDALGGTGTVASATTGRSATPTSAIQSAGFSTLDLAFQVDATSAYSLAALFSGLGGSTQPYASAAGAGALALYEDGVLLHVLNSQNPADAALMQSGVALGGTLQAGRDYRLFVQYKAGTFNGFLNTLTQSGQFQAQLTLVPVPSALLMLGSALAGLVACRRGKLAP